MMSRYTNSDELNFNYGNYNNASSNNNNIPVRRDVAPPVYKRRNNLNSGKIIRTHTIDRFEHYNNNNFGVTNTNTNSNYENNKRIDRILSNRREFNFSPVNDNDTSLDYRPIIKEQPNIHSSLAPRINKQLIDIAPKHNSSHFDDVSSHDLVNSNSRINVVHIVEQNNNQIPRSKSLRERIDDTSDMSVLVEPHRSQQPQQHYNRNLIEMSSFIKSTADLPQEPHHSHNAQNEPPQPKPRSSKIKQHHSLNAKSTKNKNDVIIRDLSSDEDGDEPSDIEITELPDRVMVTGSRTGFRTNNNDDGEDDDDVHEAKNELAVHPCNDDPLPKGRKSKNFLDPPLEIQFIHYEIYDLLKDNTMKFVMHQPVFGQTVKCFIWRSKKVFHEYTMYVELFNKETKKYDAIPILIARKKKATTKLFIRIDALSVRKNILETYKRFELGKLKSKNILSIKNFEFILTNTKRNNFNIKKMKLNGGRATPQPPTVSRLGRASSFSNNQDMVYEFNKNDVDDGAGVIRHRATPEVSRKSKEFLKINYESNLFKASKPCQINVVLYTQALLSDVTYVEPSNDDDCDKNAVSTQPQDSFSYPLKLVNKQPQYDKERKKFVLDFQKRVQFPSVNNFQLIFENDLDKIILQSGKSQKNYYICDYMYPLNAFQAFGIVLSKLCGKIG